MFERISPWLDPYSDRVAHRLVAVIVRVTIPALVVSVVYLVALSELGFRTTIMSAVLMMLVLELTPNNPYRLRRAVKRTLECENND